MTSTNGFVTSVVINGLLGITYILLFSLLRSKYNWLYAPRTLPRYKSTEYGITHAPHSTSTFGWIFDTLAVRESDVLEQAGLDAVMFIRFFSVCFKIFLIASVWMIILIPINLTASMQGDSDDDDTKLSDFDRLSMSAVPAGSSRLWAHLVAAYFLTGVVLYYFKRTWHDYLFLRHRWMRREHLKGRHLTLLIQSIPKDIQLHSSRRSSLKSPRLSSSQPNAQSAPSAAFPPANENAFAENFISDPTNSTKQLIQRAQQLAQKSSDGSADNTNGNKRDSVTHITNAFELLFKSLYPNNDCHCAWQLKDTGILGELIYQRDKTLKQLEHALIEYIETRQRPTIGLWEKQDAIEHYTSDLHYYNTMIKQLQDEVNRSGKLLPSGFVHMTHSMAAYTARNLPTTAHPSEFLPKMAPEPEDVYFPNLALTTESKYWRQLVVQAIVVVLVLAWTIPVVFAQSFTNLREISHKIPMLQPVLTYNRAVTGVLEGFLPSLIIVWFQMLLPYLLLALSTLEGIEAHSWMQMAVLRKYFLFVLFNFFLATTVASSILGVLSQVIDRPATIVDLLAKSIPKVSTFYISYILLRALTLFPLQLLRPIPLIYYIIVRNYFSRTPRELRQIEEPPQVQYGSDYADHLLVFLIGVIYAAISPIILPFCAMFFACGYVVTKYQLLYVYVSRWESGGRFWPEVYPRMMIGLIVGQLTLIGLFGLKQATEQSTLMLPLPILTYVGYRWIKTHYQEKSAYLSVEECKEVDEEIDVQMANAQERGDDETKQFKCVEQLYRQPELRARADAHPELGEYEAALQSLLEHSQSDKQQNGTSNQHTNGMSESAASDRTPLLGNESRRRSPGKHQPREASVAT